MIKEINCYNAWKFVVRHYENGSYHIQVVDIYHSYSPVAHADYLIINITIIYFLAELPGFGVSVMIYIITPFH